MPPLTLTMAASNSAAIPFVTESIGYSPIDATPMSRAFLIWP